MPPMIPINHYLNFKKKIAPRSYRHARPLIESKKKLSICESLLMSGAGKFSRAESNYAEGSTSGGAIPAIPLSFSLATILPPEPKNFDFS